jgi:hypothetical protein
VSAKRTVWVAVSYPDREAASASRIDSVSVSDTRPAGDDTTEIYHAVVNGDTILVYVPGDTAAAGPPQ